MKASKGHWEVRKYDKSMGLPEWRASAYELVVGRYATLKAANRRAEKLDQEYGAKCSWVCWVEDKEDRQA